MTLNLIIIYNNLASYAKGGSSSQCLVIITRAYWYTFEHQNPNLPQTNLKHFLDVLSARVHSSRTHPWSLVQSPNILVKSSTLLPSFIGQRTIKTIFRKLYKRTISCAGRSINIIRPFRDDPPIRKEDHWLWATKHNMHACLYFNKLVQLNSWIAMQAGSQAKVLVSVQNAALASISREPTLLKIVPQANTSLMVHSHAHTQAHTTDDLLFSHTPKLKKCDMHACL